MCESIRNSLVEQRFRLGALSFSLIHKRRGARWDCVGPNFENSTQVHVSRLVFPEPGDGLGR
jgi:hypothetical protein